MAERSALYFEMREALQAGGCPICRLGRQASDSYLNALIHEGVTDPALRQDLRDARGLCHRHAWRLAHRRGSTLGVAIVYHDVINTLARTLEEGGGSAGRRGGRQALARSLGPSARCPACKLEEEAVPRAAKTLLAYQEDPDIAAAFVPAGGLCLPHFQLTLGLAGDAQAQVLESRQLEVYRRLRDQLAELIRKHDHRFKDEPVSPEEASSWLRAVAAVDGEDEPGADEA